MRKTASTLLLPAFIALSLLCAAPRLRAADVRAIVPDYDEYKAVPRFTVDVGTVKARRVTDYASRIVIETGVSKPTKVRLRAEGYVPLRFADIRARQMGVQNSDTVELLIPKDGIGWLVVFDPPPEVSVYEFQPRSPLKVPNTGPEKARYPVVDVHAHLSGRGADIDERLKVMDAANVAIAIDSPLALTGETTEDSYRKYESLRPDRFMTFATIDFTRPRRNRRST